MQLKCDYSGCHEAILDNDLDQCIELLRSHMGNKHKIWVLKYGYGIFYGENDPEAAQPSTEIISDDPEAAQPFMEETSDNPEAVQPSTEIISDDPEAAQSSM